MVESVFFDIGWKQYWFKVRNKTRLLNKKGNQKLKIISNFQFPVPEGLYFYNLLPSLGKITVGLNDLACSKSIKA